MKNYKIFDNVQPRRWLESVPIGCGRMGATLMCGVGCERIHLNEETIWSESKGIGPNPKMPEKIRRIRDLFLQDKPAEADKLAKTEFDNCFNRIRSFEGAGKLSISLHENDHCRGYRHTLDLVNGIATVEYDKDGSHYTREYFASYPDNVIVCRVTSSNSPISARVMYDRERILSLSAENDQITATAKTVFGDHKFCIKIRVMSDGTVACDNCDIVVSDAKSFCVYIAIETEFSHGEGYVDAVKFPAVLDYEAIKARHVADFSSLMKRADVDLPALAEMAEIPQTELFKLRRWNKPKDESQFMTQWQFGRYLLISSSRNGTLPANLQGIWSEGDACEWSGDYHTNINLQANYWAAETVNLSECHLPLFDYMNKYLLESGKKTSRIGYNTRGCVVHHLSDVYGYTAPADGLWGLWPHGASWLALHMWEHYLFTKDKKFLKEQAFEFVHQASLFFLDNLETDCKGRLVLAPSTSPENHYFVNDENGNKYNCYLTSSSTMDIEMIDTLFRIYLESAKILGIEDKDVADVRETIKRLPPLSVGKFGQLMEWIEDYEETEVGHRHTSHTYGIFPSFIINRSTPEIYRAVGVTIDRRLSGQGNGASSASNVGWSMAYLGGAVARLRRAEQAYGLLNRFATYHVQPNLLDVFVRPNRDNDVFQIDGNLGYVAAMSEMLIQSHEDVIALLPALPSRWDHGSFYGLRARGGYEVSLRWENYEVKELSLHSDFDSNCVLELPEKQKTLSFTNENGKVYTVENGLLSLHLGADENIKLTIM
ncbi:MAG: glycoside hydrolase family 95 protein [Clostridia bacterium]|nr:glycoside hydrolase family 95 protein [Clostridia bacterium]